MVLLIGRIRTPEDAPNRQGVGKPALGREETRAQGLLPAGKEEFREHGGVHWALETLLVSS